jgi:2-haloacid dehalogenase
MPRVIVFDLMGTLLDSRQLDQYFERFFGAADVRREWFTQIQQLAMAAVLTNAYEDLGIQADMALELTARYHQVSLLGEEKNLILNALQKLRAYPEVARNLQRLRDAGFRLAVLTNSTARTAEEQLTDAGLRGYFEQVISADEVRSFKPAAEVYLLAAGRFGVAPEQMRLVAAHDWDATGALRAGCAAAFVGRPGQVMNPFGPQPDLIGADMDELADKILAAELFLGSGPLA